MKSCTNAKPFKPRKPLKEKINQKIDENLKSSKTSTPNFLHTKGKTQQTSEDYENNYRETQLKTNENFEKNNENLEERVECNICQRKFVGDRIEKHEAACKKANKKRPVFKTNIKNVSKF